MNLRQQIIPMALRAVAPDGDTEPVRALEVGCMFAENEGLSTYHIARCVRQRPGSAFISIEYDADHAQSAQVMLRRMDPGLDHCVDLRVGHSLVELPPALETLGQVDFALLDGGAHPEVCLQEFELVLNHLSERGLVLVDDLQALAPSVMYPAARPFGKGTLILPVLILRDYASTRDQYRSRNLAPGTTDGTPDSTLVNRLVASGIADRPSGVAYATISMHGHSMLVIGRQPVVDRLLASLPAGQSVSMVNRVRSALRVLIRPADPVTVVRSA